MRIKINRLIFYCVVFCSIMVRFWINGAEQIDRRFCCIVAKVKDALLGGDRGILKGKIQAQAYDSSDASW